MPADTGDRSDLTGRLVAGRYRLGELLGRGGMGSVWHARDELLHREVAVKTVDIPRGLSEQERDELEQRSMREARTAARLHHRSAITVHDVVMDDGQPCIVMEYVRSRSLQDIVSADGPLPPAGVAEIGLAVLGALRAAHAAGVLHRDVKPSNVLLGESGRVVLTDFGIARYEGDSRLTMTGRIIGSAGYLAPELVQGTQRATAASDLWSLGATLYAAVEGRPPYDKTNVIARLAAAVTEEPEPMRLAGPLAPMITGLMHKDPAARLDGEAAERLLAGVAQLAPPAKKRARRLAVALPVLVILGLTTGIVTFILSRGDEERSASARPPETVRTAGPAPGKLSPAPGKLTFDIEVRKEENTEQGFVIEVPKSWKQTADQNFVNFTMPGTGKMPDVLVSWRDGSLPEADPGKLAVAVLRRTEEGFRTNSRPRDYRRYRLERIPGSTGAETAEWEYSYRRPEDGRIWRVTNRHIVAESGRLYALRWRVPEDSRQQGALLARTVLDSFEDITVGDSG